MPDPVAFISYKHEPRSSLLADGLYEQLTRRGIVVWYDRELNGGEHWSQAIDAKIESAAFVIVIVTPASAASHYVTYEWSLALGMGKPVIPLLLEGTENTMHPRMSLIQHRDFRTQFNEQWKLLFRDIDRILQRTSSDDDTQPTPAVEPVRPRQPARPALSEWDKSQLRDLFRIVPPQVVKALTPGDFRNLSIYDLDETNTTFFVRIMEINELMKFRPLDTMTDKRLAQLFEEVCEKILSLRLTPGSTEDSDLVDPDAFDQSRIALKQMKHTYANLRQYVRQTYQVDVSA